MIWFLRLENCRTYNRRRWLNKSCGSSRLSLGIPVIVGVQNATKLIENGQELTIDAEQWCHLSWTCEYYLKNCLTYPKPSKGEAITLWKVIDEMAH